MEITTAFALHTSSHPLLKLVPRAESKFGMLRYWSVTKLFTMGLRVLDQWHQNFVIKLIFVHFLGLKIMKKFFVCQLCAHIKADRTLTSVETWTIATHSCKSCSHAKRSAQESCGKPTFSQACRKSQRHTNKHKAMF